MNVDRYLTEGVLPDGRQKTLLVWGSTWVHPETKQRIVVLSVDYDSRSKQIDPDEEQVLVWGRIVESYEEREARERAGNYDSWPYGAWPHHIGTPMMVELSSIPTPEQFDEEEQRFLAYEELWFEEYFDDDGNVRILPDDDPELG